MQFFHKTTVHLWTIHLTKFLFLPLAWVNSPYNRDHFKVLLLSIFVLHFNACLRHTSKNPLFFLGQKGLNHNSQLHVDFHCLTYPLNKELQSCRNYLDLHFRQSLFDQFMFSSHAKVELANELLHFSCRLSLSHCHVCLSCFYVWLISTFRSVIHEN